MTKIFYYYLIYQTKVFIIITINPKFHLPNMSTSEVIGVESSRFPAILSIHVNLRVAPVHIWSEATSTLSSSCGATPEFDIMNNMAGNMKL